MAQYPRRQEAYREGRSGRYGDEWRDRQSRSFHNDDEDAYESDRSFRGRLDRNYGSWQEEQGYDRRDRRQNEWQGDDERWNREDFNREPYRAESEWNRGYRSQETMGGMPGSSNWDEEYGRFGGYGAERSERYGWGSPAGRGAYGQRRSGDYDWQGNQGWQGRQRLQGNQGSYRNAGEYAQGGDYWQGGGYGAGGTFGQTGKYGQIGARMGGGGGYAEGYGQGAYGGFRGKGPKGYERSDDRLKEMICERLTDDDHIDASDITVDVRGGEVTLNGTVNDRMTKFRVEDLVERCGGMKDIHNNLRVSAENKPGSMWEGQREGQTDKKALATGKVGS